MPRVDNEPAQGRGARRRAARRSRRELFGLSRNTVILGGGLLIGGAAAVGLTVRSIQEGQSQKAAFEKKVAEYRTQEDQLNALLPKVDVGSTKFFAKLEAALAASTLSPADKELFATPIKLEQINRQNPIRNIYTAKRQDLEKQGKITTGELGLADINYYFYGLLDPEISAAAGFDIVEKTLFVSPKFNSESLLDNAIKLHEQVHAAQDTQDRTTLSANTYNSFQRGGARVKAVVSYEATAYATEVSALDLILGGKLKKDAVSGTFSEEEYMRLLGARADQKELVALLAELGREYFTSGSSYKSLSAPFLRYITQLHIATGHELYERTPSGFTRVG
jgi:hypothetical protein